MKALGGSGQGLEYELNFCVPMLLLIAMVLVGCSLSGLSGLGSHELSERRVAEKCEKWLSENPQPLKDPSHPVSVHRINGGVCISGKINRQMSTEFGDAISNVDIDELLTVVIRSPGGDVDYAMDMAEAMLPLRTSVVAAEYCASSCANYIMMAGDRRHVLDGTLLMFHGGVNFESLNAIADQLYEIDRKGGRINLDREIASAREDLLKKVARQEMIASQSGVSPHFFRWMDLINHVDPKVKLEICPGDTSMIVYDPTVLASFGFVFRSYGGPLSQLDTSKLAESMGVRGSICFWSADERTKAL